MRLFPAETYKKRREQLLSQLNGGVYLIMGNNESPMNCKDNTYRFRQDSNFLYFFGLNIPNVAATLDASTGNVTLYGNDFSVVDVIWMGQQATMKELGAQVGVENTKPFSALATDLKNDVNYLPPYRHDRVIFLADILKKSTTEISSEFSVPLIEAVVKLRSVKDDLEIAEMTEAVNISRELHINAMQIVASGKKEYEIVAEIYATAKRSNCYLAYPAICTVNGQTLHNHYHGNTLQESDLFLNDSGAENDMCYSGDITRTIPVSKRFSNQQKDIYNLVLKMEEDCIADLKPGLLNRDSHLAANRIMLNGLKEQGLVKGDVDTMVELGVGGLFMPHGLGHMIGLDVHDMEDLGEKYVGYREGLERSTQLGLKSLRLAKELEEGFVITVEPGIYFIPELIKKWRAEKMFTDFINYEKLENYYDFGGIRIEDDVLITAEGSQVLGKRIPKTTEEIEGLHC
ncbi:Xaa-Pro aminopeptidase [Spirosomataceae bacterium TFI 002]|nr:Xaa-Pro aminopeptidase [Spirosomataceae bacterium TFI 002]